MGSFIAFLALKAAFWDEIRYSSQQILLCGKFVGSLCLGYVFSETVKKS